MDKQPLAIIADRPPLLLCPSGAPAAGWIESEHFVGRRESVGWLESSAPVFDPSGSRIVAIIGLPGSGKTELVRRLARAASMQHNLAMQRDATPDVVSFWCDGQSEPGSDPGANRHVRIWDPLSGDLEPDPPTAASPVAVTSGDSPWRALPAYGHRPFTMRACCRPAAVWAVFDAPETAAHEAPLPGGVDSTFIHELRPVITGFFVTVRAPQLARGHRANLLRVIGGIIAALRLMLVLLMAALTRRPTTLLFLLVMLGCIRHYGRRGEPHAHFLPAVLQLASRWGAACPAVT